MILNLTCVSTVLNAGVECILHGMLEKQLWYVVSCILVQLFSKV